jgi:HEAT repeat protein
VPSETVSAAIDFTDVFNRARSPDVLARQAAARELEAAKPAGPNTRVMGLLDEMLRTDDDHFVRASAVRALERWGGRDGVPMIVRTLDDPHFAVQWAAIDVLAHLKDPRGIEPLAHDIVVNKNRAFASGALQTIGPASEGAARRLLGDHDGWVRLEGCKILKAVGSRTAIPALERLAAHDTDGLVVMGARDAIRTIEERK